MKVKLIRLGSLITLYNGIYGIFYGILTIIFTRIILSEYFRKIPVNWSIFEGSFPFRAKLYSFLLLIHAFSLIALGISIVFLSYLILKKRDKFSWVVLFSIGLFSWASLFVINILVGSWITIAASFIGWASFVIGMLIPIKYYITKGLAEF